ncbi:MAG: DNA repair protein RecO [Dysgonamonadaceae bacterium]|jgi:DNA repair protein RecO (recombination protein O)|nr:DNA repair protein RecO [Dysgonamonadaceae bacterium]
MQHKTRGIVLYSSAYSDKYAITVIYTEEFGRVSYLTAKSKSRKTKTPKSLFHALAVLDLEVEHQNLREIQRIKEAKAHFPLPFILNDPVKGAIGIFLADLISKLIREIQPDKLLFEYILQSIRILEFTEKTYANFHLVFMVGLTRFLGFYPDVSTYRKGMFFDLQNGVFTLYKPSHPHHLNPDESLIFFNFLRMTFENMGIFKFSRNERNVITGRILEYYRLHLNNFPEIKSLTVLQTVFA